MLRSQMSQESLLSSPAHSEGDHTPDTAETCYQSKDICQELSDLVVYTEPVKFNWFKVQCSLVVQVRLAITLVWKVQVQQFKHFYIACNELIHMDHLNQKCFPLKICRDRIIV